MLHTLIERKMHGWPSAGGRRRVQVAFSVSVLLLVACAGASNHVRPGSPGGVSRLVGFDRSLTETALGISEVLIRSEGRWTVAVASLVGPGGTVTPFGEYVASALDARLAGRNITLVDRMFAGSATREILRCAREGDLQTCASAGKFHGANVIVTGRYEAFEEYIRLFFKAIETETAVVVYVTEAFVATDGTMLALLGRGGDMEEEKRAIQPSSRHGCW